MHLHGGNYFCTRQKKLFALHGGEMDEGQTLSQFCLTFDKESGGKTAALLSLGPSFNKAPIEGKKTADTPFLFPLRGKYLTLRLSLKGQTTRNLMETKDIHFPCHTDYHLSYNKISKTRRGDMSSRGVENVRTTLWPFDCCEYRWASNTLLMSERQPVSFCIYSDLLLCHCTALCFNI